VVGPRLDLLRAEAAAVHIQAHPDPVDQYGDEYRQQPRNGRQRPADVKDEADGRHNLDQGQPDRHRHQQRVGDDAVGVDQRGKRLGIGKLGRAGIQKHDRQRPADQSIVPRGCQHIHHGRNFPELKRLYGSLSDKTNILAKNISQIVNIY
jgi:hypothetical protein